MDFPSSYYGNKKKSWLAGETQTLKIDVRQDGKALATFKSASNNKHPVGNCMRSALDGLHFEKTEAALTVEVPVRLGQPQGKKAVAQAARDDQSPPSE